MSDDQPMYELAALISRCIDAADAAGKHVVAAHLDSALAALSGAGRPIEKTDPRDADSPRTF